MTYAALERFCPMHAVIDSGGLIVRAGATLCKLVPDLTLGVTSLTELFHVDRPQNDGSVSALRQAAGSAVRLRLRNDTRIRLTGDVVALDDDAVAGVEDGLVLNLSFGISIVDAVRAYSLTASDFAKTDLAIELLYLVEAKSAAMSVSRKLNKRLHGAKIAAEEQAYTDTLTGLKNRRAMALVFDHLLDSEQEFAVMQLDLDFFKQVNDTLGHAAGDHVLRVVADALRAEIKAGDAIIRVGGDEFVLVFAGLTDPLILADVAGRLIRRIEEPIFFENQRCGISASIGAALSCDHDQIDTEQLLADADAALYGAKKAGRGCCRVWSPGGVCSADGIKSV